MEKTYEQLLHDLRNNTGNYDHDIFNSIFMNPIVKELPDFAGAYGLYAKFVVTDLHLFFVFGYDENLIKGEWYAHGRTLTPQSYIDKFGYIDNPALFGLAYQVFLIENPVNLNYLGSVMSIMELLHNSYIDNKVEEPKFVYSAASTVSSINGYRTLTDNPFFNSKEGIELGRNLTRELLNNIAIYDFPVTSHTKIGESAFNAAGVCRYGLDEEEPKECRKLWKNPGKWDDALKKFKLFRYRFSASKECIKFIAKRLDEVNVPYIIGDPDRKISNGFMDKLNKDIQDAVGAVNYKIYDDETIICTTIADHGALMYALSLWGLNLFTEEEIAYGQKIADNNMSYIMPVPELHLEAIRMQLKEMDVPLGMADCDMAYDFANQGVLYLAVSGSNCGILHYAVTNAWEQVLSAHHVSVWHTGRFEYRLRQNVPNSLTTHTDNFLINGAPANARYIQEGATNVKSLKQNGYYVSNHSNPLRLEAEKIGSDHIVDHRKPFFRVINSSEKENELNKYKTISDNNTNDDFEQKVNIDIPKKEESPKIEEKSKYKKTISLDDFLENF